MERIKYKGKWSVLIIVICWFGVMCLHDYTNIIRDRADAVSREIACAGGSYKEPIEVRVDKDNGIDIFKYITILILALTCNALYKIKHRIEFQNHINGRIMKALEGAEVSIEE